MTEKTLGRTEGEVRQGDVGGGNAVGSFRTFEPARAATPDPETGAQGTSQRRGAPIIYVASSWRNVYQPDVVAFLRSLGCDVYDFRNPEPGNAGFSWSEIDPNWKAWTPHEYREALEHPVAAAGFGLDFAAMQRANTCVLVLPSGRSASFEYGWCVGQGKRGIVYMPEACEPELMYRGTEIVTDLGELGACFTEAA